MVTESNTAINLTVVEAFDAAEVDFMFHHLPKANKLYRYRLRNRASAPSSAVPLCRHVLRAAGDLQVSRVHEQLGMRISIIDPGIAAYCFATIHSGAMELSRPGIQQPAVGSPAAGLVLQAQAGTAALTLDGTTRTNLWVSQPRIDAALAAVLDDIPRQAIVFEPVVEWKLGAGPSIERLLQHAAAEFGEAGRLPANALALASFTDLFVHTALTGLPNNFSARLARPTETAAPRNLRRAEAFMWAEARQPIRLADMAGAAGCSVRALQDAFRSFRDTTPHRALQGIRLELAQAELRLGDDPVSAVALRYGFSNAARFSALYARRYGERPRARR